MQIKLGLNGWETMQDMAMQPAADLEVRRPPFLGVLRGLSFFRVLRGLSEVLRGL
jgi:hypothetical protein